MRALPVLASALVLCVPLPSVAQEAAGEDERAKRLAQLPVAELIASAQRKVGELGTYKLRLIKQERVGGKLLPQQTMELFIQQAPLAIIGEVVAGPAKGRRLLYNAALRTDEFRVKEAGILGAAGPVWIGLEHRMTRRDTRHPATNLGYAPVLALIEQDFKKGRAAGGHVRKDEGFVGDSYCMLYTAPKGVKDLYADKARLCVDPVSLLPTLIETFDSEGLMERLAFQLRDARVKTTGVEFTVKGAGL